MFWLNTTQFSGLAYAHNKGDITLMELHRLRMPWKKLWDLTSQQLWITQKWFSFCLTSHSIYSHSYSTTNHPHSCCTHWPRSISLWTQPQYPELRIQASGWAYTRVAMCARQIDVHWIHCVSLALGWTTKWELRGLHLQDPATIQSAVCWWWGI